MENDYKKCYQVDVLIVECRVDQDYDHVLGNVLDLLKDQETYYFDFDIQNGKGKGLKTYSMHDQIKRIL